MTRPSGVADELSELHRRCRYLEADRKSYVEDTQAIIRKQRATADKLRMENETLKEELRLQTRHARQTNNINAAAQIAALEEQVAQYTRHLEEEKEMQALLDEQSRTTEERIQQLRLRVGSVDSTRSQEIMARQTHVLETRLDKALVKFNESLATNKTLRDEIELLRKGRATFDGIYKKLEKELREKKKSIADVIEWSNAAYEARDQTHQEILSLRLQEEKERAAFEAEYSELTRAIEEERKAKDLLRIKERERVAQPEPGDDEGKKKKPKALQSARDRIASSIDMEKVQSYEEAFERIRHATGIEDIDVLVTTFIANEEAAFSMFSEVNELNHEIEKGEDAIVQLRKELAQMSLMDDGDDSQKKKIVEDLQEKLDLARKKGEDFETKVQTLNRTILALKAGIQSLFTRIGCSTTTVSDMFGDQGVTETNIIQYLGIIEQRVNEVVATIQGSTTGRSGPPAIRGASGALLSIEPPSTSEDFDSDVESDDDDDHPLSWEEMRSKTLKNLSRREGNEAITTGGGAGGTAKGKARPGRCASKAGLHKIPPSKKKGRLPPPDE